MYVVIGATGNTGSVVVEKLLAGKQQVRAVGRDAKRLQRFAQNGAEPFVADVTDATVLTKAFAGAKAVYVLIPPNLGAKDVRAYQERVNNALAAAIAKSGVTHAVALSSIGADKPDKTGLVVGLHNLEQKLNAISGLNAIYLRAGYFMENILPQIGVIQSLGKMAGPLRADLPLAMTATRDIGAWAAETLLKLNFQGKSVQELHGMRDVTYAEVAKIVGTAIGQPGLAYMQVPAAQLKPVLTQMGMSPSMADLLLEMSEALNSGYMAPLMPRSPENTAATTIETFVNEVFAPAFKGKAARA
jgi:uncharacterized protein YbjT (DUF2867 family)